MNGNTEHPDEQMLCPQGAVHDDRTMQRWAADHPNADIEPCGVQHIKNIWFSGLWIVLDYFISCVKFQKRARIVIDYDPQAVNTIITYYQAKEKHDQPEC